MGDRGKAETKGAARNGLGGVNLIISEVGERSFPYQDGNASFVRVDGKRGEETEGVVDGAEGQKQSSTGTVDFLKKHNVNWNKQPA